VDEDKLAIDGGGKAVPALGPYPSKIGKDELMAVLDLWALSDEAREKIRGIIDNESDDFGPHLFRYYNPRASKVAEAEQAMCARIGVKRCLAVNSCTSALIAAYRALGIGAGDEVIVPAYTFFATAAAVVAANAIPVIVEVDKSLSLDPNAVAAAITRRTRAIAVAHMRGAPARMGAIMEIAERKGLPVVEDVAQAAGGSFHGRQLGSIGTIGCFSFDFYKIAVSGEGGFVATDDEWLYTRAQSWHDTAACWRPERYASERREGELFCGENYRMSELQGAVALTQMRKLDDLVASCRRAKGLIKDAIDRRPGIEFRCVADPDGDIGMQLIFFLEDSDLARKAISALQAEGVPAGGVYDSTVRDWHIYKYWDHILQQKTVAPDGLPWSAVPEEELPAYSPEMCPRTLELLGRSIHVDINPHYTEPECAAIARGINKVMQAMLE